MVSNHDHIDDGSWKPALVIGLSLVVVDALVLYQGILTLMFLFGLAVAALPRLIMPRDDVTRHERLRNLGIYACAIIAVFVINEANMRVTRERADMMVKAIEQYRAHYGHYPTKLVELVPEFIPELPSVRYSIPLRNFEYGQAEKGPVLAYVAAPPFSRPTYDFSRGHWVEGVKY